jgi:hypothetical protein
MNTDRFTPEQEDRIRELVGEALDQIAAKMAEYRLDLEAEEAS